MRFFFVFILINTFSLNLDAENISFTYKQRDFFFQRKYKIIENIVCEVPHLNPFMADLLRLKHIHNFVHHLNKLLLVKYNTSQFTIVNQQAKKKTKERKHCLNNLNNASKINLSYPNPYITMSLANHI